MHARESIDYDHNTDEGFNFDRLRFPAVCLPQQIVPTCSKFSTEGVSDAEAQAPQEAQQEGCFQGIGEDGHGRTARYDGAADQVTIRRKERPCFRGPIILFI